MVQIKTGSYIVSLMVDDLVNCQPPYLLQTEDTETQDIDHTMLTF